MPSTIPSLPSKQFQLPQSEAYKKLGSRLGDRRDGRVYVHDDRINTAVRVALATNRPLLLRGEPGSGKSSLAPFIARAFERRFYWETVTARSQARDLMWTFDALGRLSDAQIGTAASRKKVERLENYVEPRALWWAFDPPSARRRGLETGRLDVPTARDPGEGLENAQVVVLIDEIDKADPDVPNNLLESLGSLQFTVEETRRLVSAQPDAAPLVIITTNEERELPAAFHRRCTVLFLKPHTPTDLIRIAEQHFPDKSAFKRDLFSGVADRVVALRDEAKKAGRRQPSTAEYLDAVRACLDLDVDPAAAQGEWSRIVELTLQKYDVQSDGAVTSTAGAAR